MAGSQEGSSSEGKCGKNKGAGSKPSISTAYTAESLVETLAGAFSKKEEFKHDATGTTLFSSPFHCCQMPDFLEGADYLENLVTELNGHDVIPKNNDLYKFEQTDDLKVMSTPCAKYLRELFLGPVRDWMKRVTGIPLNDKVDLTCSRYGYTDTLLCHDDELDSRRIAFILYLVPVWEQKDGGALDLFDMDEYGQPNKIVKSLIPKWNTFNWFEVTEASHHQVGEVLSKEKVRLSVNGWFHGPVVSRPERHREKRPALSLARPLQAEVALSWINPMYWDEEVQLEIQQKFEEDSEIELTDFLSEEKYKAVVTALQDQALQWNMSGPPNKRQYLQLSDTQSQPDIVRQCVEVLTSEPVFLLLSQLTGLALHSLANEAQRRAKEVSEKERAWLNEQAMQNERTAQKEENCEDSERQTTHVGNLGECENNETLSKAGESACDVGHIDKKAKLQDEGSASQEGGASSTAEKQETACCHSCIRKWRQGFYTLAHDTNSELGELALDAVFYMNCGDWNTDHGGHTSYIAAGEDEELLTICPQENSLALVFRDEETLKFVKHINHQATYADKPEFCDIAISYYEKNGQDQT